MDSRLLDYKRFLIESGYSASTCRQYIRAVGEFLRFCDQKTKCGTNESPPTRQVLLLEYRELLLASYQPSSVNVKLAAINGYLAFCGHADIRAAAVRLQRRTFRSPQRELSREEYHRLIAAAAKCDDRLALLLQTLASTGMRISELQFVTVESLETGRCTISLKGKTRCCLLPSSLRALLARYAAHHDIRQGPVFVTKTGRPLDRSNIWKSIKKLCATAEVDPCKAFPHNFRHLFARTFYEQDKDLAHLADILGHSSVDTTRIYVAETAECLAEKLDATGLVIGTTHEPQP